MDTLKKLKSESTELPDCIISQIFSKLSLKNLVKTSALSKHWYHEWGLRKDLTFDLHNIFDNTVPKLPITLLQSQFAAILDNFMRKYPGDMIRSIRVKFPLGADHTYAIDRLIHKAVLKGANRIKLLFAYKTHLKIEPYNFLLSGPNSLTYLHLQNCHIAATMDFSGLKNLTTLALTLVPVDQNMLQDMCFNCIHLKCFTLNECPFLSDLKITSPTLLHLNIFCRNISRPKSRNIDIIASNLLSIDYSSGYHSYLLHKLNINSHMLSNLTYRCAKIFNLEFSTLTNLTTVMMDGLREGHLITHLFSKCLQLEDVTIITCRFSRELKINSAKLRHLRIVNCRHLTYLPCKIDIHALNLSSFEYRGHKGMRSIISVEAPKLLNVFWDAGFNKINIYNFATIARLHQVENFPMHMSLPHVENFPMHMSLSQISELTKEYLVQFKKLRQLELFIAGAYNPKMDYFSILDIEMASQHPPKLSLSIRMGVTEISSHKNG